MNKFIIFFLLALISSQSLASTYPKVEADLTEYDENILQMMGEFSELRESVGDKIWVRQKLAFMVKIDQYTRKSYLDLPYQHDYSEAERVYFQTEFGARLRTVDRDNITDLKELLQFYDWFKVSVFGPTSDDDAWLLVQHADQDIEFQKQVLDVLEKLYPLGETKRAHYAYLYDRIAASPFDLSKQKPQRYGTQGSCTGPGVWEPYPVEDPAHVDKRRAEMGLGSMSEYKAGFKDICH